MGTDHDKPDVRSALRRAVKAGMVVTEIHKGHRWGTLSCPECEASMAVYCTPKSPSVIANRIREFTRRHIGCEEGETA